MKKYLLIFSFIIIPFWAFCQLTYTINNTATYGGVAYITEPPPAWYTVQQISYIDVGSTYGSDSGKTGRGFLKFDLSNVPSDAITYMTGASLVLTIGNFFYAFTNDTVKINRTAVKDVLNDAKLSSRYDSLGFSSNILINTAIIPVGNKNFTVSIDKQTIIEYRNANTPLTMAVIHANEKNRGIEINDAKLVITYTQPLPPSAPTNVQASNITSTGCTLSWTASSGATKYEVYNNTTLLKDSIASTSTSLTLSSNTSYSIIVKAVNSFGSSPGSSPVTVITPPEISGSNYLCYGSPQTFSITNWQSGQTWEKSSNLNISGSGGSVTVSAASSSFNGTGWVSINQGGQELVRKGVWIGGPIVTISGDAWVPMDYIYKTYNAISQNYFGSAITSYDWLWQSDPSNPMYNYGYWVNIYFNVEGISKLSLRACNTCGWGPYDYLYITAGNPSPSSVYPNPVSDMLNIDVSKNANSQSAGVIYDILLYNEMGMQLRKTNSNGKAIVQFDVSNLPNGIYYVHIFDGVKSTPEIHKIIVQH